MLQNTFRRPNRPQPDQKRPIYRRQACAKPVAFSSGTSKTLSSHQSDPTPNLDIQGDLANCNGTSSDEDIWQEYLLAAEDWEDRFLANPIGTLVDGELQPKPGIHEWGNEITCEVDETTLRQYRKMWPKVGRKTKRRARYLVWARLKVHRTGPGGMDVALSWEIAPPSFRRHTNGEICSHARTVQLLIPL